MGKDDLLISPRLKTSCPRCNSPQSFKARQRPKGDRIEIFIGCTMCRWERVIFTGTPEQVKLRKDIDKMRGKAMRGDPVQPVLRKRQERFRNSQ